MAVTSEYFRANLGLLDSDAAGMLDPWCQRTYEQLHRQRSFWGVCPHGILSPTQVPQVASDSNPDRILQFRTSAEYLARRWFQNDNYEELLELWEKLKAKYARV